MVSASLLQTGVAGVQAGLQRAERAAADIARVSIESSGDNIAGSNDDIIDIAESAVSLIEAKNQVQASAKVISVADEMLGTLLDTIA